MITNLEVKNFKSIKHLKLDCKRINIFIGEPNTGKSNILEALGIFSFGGYGNKRETTLDRWIRFESMSNLFYDENLEESVNISLDNKILNIRYVKGAFEATCVEQRPTGDAINIFNFTYDYAGHGSAGFSRATSIRFYRFAIKGVFPGKEPEYLLPPSGDNLLAILRARKDLRNTIGGIFKGYGLRLLLEPQEGKMKLQKEYDEILISYPYQLISDTLQRVIFHLAAIDSNRESVIAFEEPESHSFPYYTKYLAERIALDENKNQYFITTHNPYLLFSILEKAPKEDVGIFITYFEDYQTKVKELSEGEKEEIMELEMDIFFNIRRFLEKG